MSYPTGGSGYTAQPQTPSQGSGYGAQASGYGTPASSQGSGYGTQPQTSASAGSESPAAAQPANLGPILTIAVAALGVIIFLLGFTPFSSFDSPAGGSIDSNFFESIGFAWLILPLFAATSAGTALLSKKDSVGPAAAAAVAGFLIALVVSFQVGGESGSLGWGGWIVLFLSFVQAIVAVGAFLFAAEIVKMSPKAPRPAQSQQQFAGYQQGQYGQVNQTGQQQAYGQGTAQAAGQAAAGSQGRQGGQAAQSFGQQQPSYGQQGGFGQQSSFGQQPQQSFGQQQPSYGQQPQQSQPTYGRPEQTQYAGYQQQSGGPGAPSSMDAPTTHYAPPSGSGAQGSSLNFGNEQQRPGADAQQRQGGDTPQNASDATQAFRPGEEP